MVHSCLNWKKHERCVAVTWSRMVSWLSRWTPRLDTVVENWTLADNSWSSTMSTLASCCRDPIHITWVFSAFILSLLQLIYDSIFSVQLTNRWTAVQASEAPVLTWTCVLSAYEWAFMSSLLMMSSNSRNSRNIPAIPGTEEVQAWNLVGHCRSTSCHLLSLVQEEGSYPIEYWSSHAKCTL